MNEIFSRECPFTGQTCIMRACERACSALREDARKNYFHWLIEAPGQQYLGFQKLNSSTSFKWIADANKALAFRSYAQADDFMTALRAIDRELDSSYNFGKLSWGKLFAFEPTLGNARAVEHGFCVLSSQDRPRSEKETP